MDTILGPFTNDSQITSAGNQHHLIFDRTNQRLDLHTAGTLRVLTGLSGSSDPATGNDLGSERLRITAEGNVGIGAPVPAARLHVDEGDILVRRFPSNDTTPSLTRLMLSNRSAGGNRVEWALYTAAVGGGWGVNPNAFEIWEYPATAPRLQIRSGGNTVLAPSGGNVGIGTTGPQRLLQIGGDVAGMGFSSADASPNAGYIRFGDNTGWKLHIGRSRESSGGALNTGLTGVLMTIQDNGNVGIGTLNVTAGYRLEVAGRALSQHWDTPSDARYKTNITRLTGVLDKLEQVQGVAFEWNDHSASLGATPGAREIGLLAQEVEAVFPELVTTSGDAGCKALDYGRLTAVLLEAVKELKASNVALHQRIAVLEHV